MAQPKALWAKIRPWLPEREARPTTQSASLRDPEAKRPPGREQKGRNPFTLSSTTLVPPLIDPLRRSHKLRS